MKKLFRHVLQRDAMDCGPACLKMICESYGKKFSLETLREKSHLTREGVSLLGISDAAENLGLRTIASKITYNQLHKQAPKPCIVHWNANHFVVVYKVTKNHV